MNPRTAVGRGRKKSLLSDPGPEFRPEREKEKQKVRRYTMDGVRKKQHKEDNSLTVPSLKSRKSIEFIPRGSTQVAP